jgi:ferritin-like metal-binding protein YciE
MAAPDREVKKAAELKLWLEGRIAQLQDEIERLKETLEYVDVTLRASTFKPAIEMMAESREIPEVR